MISSSQFLCLFLLACPIYCLTYDYVNLKFSTLEELSQSQLSSSNKEVLKWGSAASDIYKCAYLSNKYFDTMSYQATLSKSFTDLTLHDYVYVTFDAMFMNIVGGTSRKSGSVTIDGTAQSFSVSMKKDYKCMTNKSNYVDGTASVGLLFSHSNTSMKVSIKPSDVGTQGRLGISNMKIYVFKCGSNASFDTSKLTCVCDSGYLQTDFQATFTNGNPYTNTKCVKQ